MAIQKIYASQPLRPSFSAKTTIIAPKNMLSKKDRDFLSKVGEKIGKDTDTIQIKVGTLQDSKVDPGVKSYTVSAIYDSTSTNGRYSKKVDSSFLYSFNNQIVEKNRPKIVIKRFLDSIKEPV